MTASEQFADHEIIDTKEKLEGLYQAPLEIAKAIMLDSMDEFHQAFIQHSPFISIATSNSEGQPTISPKGDAPGFVKILDDKHLVIPDRIGNNKLESFHNLIENPKIGLIFFIPGYKETLRVSGTAKIVRSDTGFSYSQVDGRSLDVGLMVNVTKCYFHCGKAIIRSKLWKADYVPSTEVMPSFGKVILRQSKSNETETVLDELVQHAYQNELY